MPLVAFDIPSQQVHETCSMPTPKRMIDVGAWYMGARKALGDRFPADRIWVVRHTDATLDYVRIELVDPQGVRAHITIKRRDE